jgi:hypothetical protein
MVQKIARADVIPDSADDDPDQRQPKVRGRNREHEPGCGDQARQRQVFDLASAPVDPRRPDNHRHDATT